MQLSGCSSARLEYTSGGRGVAGSNPVIPTKERGKILIILPLLFFSTPFSTPILKRLRYKQLVAKPRNLRNQLPYFLNT